MSEEARGVPPTEPADVPSVGAVLYRGPGHFLLYTTVIGVGIATVWCLGLGFVIMWLGSRGLLTHAAVCAGVKPADRGGVAASWAVALAVAVGAAGYVEVSLGVGYPVAWLGVSPRWVFGAVGVAVAGAVLAPLALAPVASACGVPGKLSPAARAVHLAGVDGLVRLAPLGALITVALVAPIPFVAQIFGATGDEPGRIVLGLLALGCWILAVPVSAAALTVRYLRLERRDRAPAGLWQATAPGLAAFLIGLVALGVGLTVTAPTSTHLSPGWLGSDPAGEGQLVELGWDTSTAYPIRGTDLRAVAADGILSVSSSRSEETHAIPLHYAHSPRPRPAETICRAYPRADGGAVFVCDCWYGRVDATFDATGRPVPSELADRMAVQLGAPGLAGVALALIAMFLALVRLARARRHLRLIGSPPFAFEGTLRVPEDGEGEASVVFESADGQRVRVPRSCVAKGSDEPLLDGQSAVLASRDPVAPMSYRTAEAECPPDARLVVGSREEALARRLERVRTVVFRFGLVSLAGLAVAGFLAVLAPW